VEDFLLQRPSAISRKGHTKKRSTATKLSNRDTGRWPEARGTFNLVSWLRSGCQYFCNLLNSSAVTTQFSYWFVYAVYVKSHATRSVSN
jgi:hypothetical protein